MQGPDFSTSPRHDDDGFSVALFDWAAGAVAVRASTPLLTSMLLPELGAWLDRYGRDSVGVHPARLDLQ